MQKTNCFHFVPITIVFLEHTCYRSQLICGAKVMQRLEEKMQVINGNQWHTFHGMHLFMMLYHQTGWRMHEDWDSPYQNAWTEIMSKAWFTQICSILNFNDNEDLDGMDSDSLQKVPPLLTLQIIGSIYSLDKGTMAWRSSYEMHLIVHNGMMPPENSTSRYICCAVHLLVWYTN